MESPELSLFSTSNIFRYFSKLVSGPVQVAIRSPYPEKTEPGESGL